MQLKLERETRADWKGVVIAGDIGVSLWKAQSSTESNAWLCTSSASCIVPCEARH